MRSPLAPRIARHAVDLVMLVLLIAGVLKAIDITEFADALRTWTLLPQWVPLVLAPIVPTAEIAIGLAWFLGLWRRPAHLAAIALLTTFTFVYTLHLAFGRAPTCGCLGLLQAFKSSADEAKVILARNAVLVGLLLVGLRRRPDAVQATATIPVAQI